MAESADGIPRAHRQPFQAPAVPVEVLDRLRESPRRVGGEAEGEGHEQHSARVEEPDRAHGALRVGGAALPGGGPRGQDADHDVHHGARGQTDARDRFDEPRGHNVNFTGGRVVCKA